MISTCTSTCTRTGREVVWALQLVRLLLTLSTNFKCCLTIIAVACTFRRSWAIQRCFTSNTTCKAHYTFCHTLEWLATIVLSLQRFTDDYIGKARYISKCASGRVIWLYLLSRPDSLEGPLRHLRFPLRGINELLGLSSRFQDSRFKIQDSRFRSDTSPTEVKAKFVSICNISLSQIPIPFPILTLIPYL